MAPPADHAVVAYHLAVAVIDTATTVASERTVGTFTADREGHTRRRAKEAADDVRARQMVAHEEQVRVLTQTSV